MSMSKKQFNINPFDLSHKYKPIYSNKKLPQFSITGGWSDGGKWNNEGVSFSITQKPNTKNVVVTPQGKKLKQIENKTGIYTTSEWMNPDTLKKETEVGGWIHKDTLKKGTDTLLGMNKQVDQFGNVVRGENYANPDFYAYENKKKHDQKKYDLYEQTGGLIGEKEPESQGTNKPSESKPGPGGTTTDSTNYSNKSLNKLSAARADASLNYMRSNPNLATANVIRKNLGMKEMFPHARWRRRGRYAAAKWVVKSWSKSKAYRFRQEYITVESPESFLTSFYKKEAVVDWGKTKGLKLEETDTGKFRTGSYSNPNYWTHNGRSRLTGYNEKIGYATHAPKNKDQITDVLYSKLMNKAGEKKAKYETYYKTDPDVERYNYYPITDESFESYETYKQNLISSIGARRENQEYIIKDLGIDTKTIEKKDRSKKLIPTLESTTETLDDKASVLKDEITNYDWQKKIAQENFGTDTIQGDSHVGHVLQSYEGKVRGGDYYIQDAGRLIKKTKNYEDEIKSQIEESQKVVEEMEPDKTEGLVDYYSDVRAEEETKASEDYLSKSLDLTMEERKQLEQSRKAQMFGSNAPARSGYTPTQSRGRPSLKSFSKRQYKNRRTRGGKNTFGGLVI